MSDIQGNNKNTVRYLIILLVISTIVIMLTSPISNIYTLLAIAFSIVQLCIFLFAIQRM